MQRRVTMTRSSGSATRAKMNTSLALLMCCVVGSAVGYNVRREAPYNIGPNDPYAVAVNPNYSQEPSQRLFWGTQGSNQVGGTGLWATLTNKFPFLGNMFGRMELPTEYGVPNRYDTSQQFGVPNQYVSSQFGFPNRYEVPQHYGTPGYQQPQFNQGPQFNQVPQFYQGARQQAQQFGQRFSPSGRDVGLTDDAVIVTPPFVPINEPIPVPAPAPAPTPVAPAPAPGPSPGYQYNKPQYRLEYPHK